MDNRKRLSTRKKGSTHRQYYSRADRINNENKEGIKREKLLVQFIVSGVMLLIVITISTFNTSLSSSLKSRLETAIKTSITTKDLAVWKEQSQTAIEELGDNTGEFLNKLGIKKKVDKTDNKVNENKVNENKEIDNGTETEDSITENSTKTNEISTENKELKNQNPPEVILPES